MSSKAFVFLGLLLAFVLLISSEVAANEVAKETNGVEEAKYPGGGGGYPGGGGYQGGGGYPGGGGYQGGGGYPGQGRGGGYCRYGRCCGRGRGYYGRRGCPCCYSAHQAAQETTQNKPQN